MNLLDLAQSQKIIEEIAKAGFGKINFAGGEPLTYKPLGHLIRLAKHLNLKTSIITNGSLLTKDWLKENVKFLDIIGISCDSSIKSTQKILGRGKYKVRITAGNPILVNEYHAIHKTGKRGTKEAIEKIGDELFIGMNELIGR